MTIAQTKTVRIAAQRRNEDINLVRARQRAIGRQLRGLFDDVVAEGIPDEFDDLLDQLDKSREQTPPDRAAHAGDRRGS